jgi:uncharacterized protein (DUF849 family)
LERKMSNGVVITCAITGAGDTTDKHPAIPITPEEIAVSSIEAAKAGAAVVHIHVRDPETGKASRDPALFREVVDRIRSSETDVIINLTGGMGGDLVLGPTDDPGNLDDETDLAPALERLNYIEELLPDICTLDCGTMNIGDGNFVLTNTPAALRVMAERVSELGIRPEIEVFDLGHIVLAKQLIAEGLIKAPPLFQLCLGIPYGAPADAGTMKFMADQLPNDAVWSGFGISRYEFPMVAHAVGMGGNVRVGLEDNIYLEKGVFASNAQLVEKAHTIIELLGAHVADPVTAREKFGCKVRS